MIDGSLSLMYNNTFRGHNLNICLSSSMRQTQSTASETHYRGFPGGDLVSSNYAAEVYGKPSSSDNTTRLVGALFTSNYTYNNIYLADLTGRIDGSSEFGSDKRWSMFWSTGAGINIHNYDFMKSNELFSMLKFRASYGLTGKTNFSLYSAKDMYQLQTDSWYPTGYGVFLYQMGNPNLKWERKYTLDYGIEIGLWHDKVYLKASAYDERTIDLITDYTIPSSTGFTSYKENMGKVKNTGVELELRMRLYSDRNWLLQLYGSFARNKDTIVEISQAMRDYNKRVEELFSGGATQLDPDLDPKVTWALRNLERFPVEVNKASYEMLMRIPGIGAVSARRIVRQRRVSAVRFEDLKKMGVVLKRAIYFITCGGRQMYPTKLQEDYILRNIMDGKEMLPAGVKVPSYEQLSLFDDPRFSV